MAFIQFPDEIQVKVLDSDDVASASEMGSFTTTENTELSHIRVMFLKHGTAGGSETLQLKLSLSNDVSRSHLQSNIVSLSDWSTDEYFLGWMTFDFERKHLDSDNQIYAFLEHGNYTRNADVYYLAWSFDDVWATNATNAANDFGAAMQIIGNT